jgi:hypothetical protein
MKTLPVELILNVFKFLEIKDLQKMRLTCKQMLGVIRNNKELIARSILREYGFEVDPEYYQKEGWSILIHLDKLNIKSPVKVLSVEITRYCGDKKLTSLFALLYENLDGRIHRCAYEYIEIIKFINEEYIFSQENKDNQLRWAGRSGCLDVVKYLLENGADIHHRNDTVIFSCVRHKRHVLIKYLLGNFTFDENVMIRLKYHSLLHADDILDEILGNF